MAMQPGRLLLRITPPHDREERRRYDENHERIFGPKYRCGWCGMPTDKDGEPLMQFIGRSLPKEYDDATLVNGACCPDGDGSYDRDGQSRRVTRDMALDAGDPSLEGMPI